MPSILRTENPRRRLEGDIPVTLVQNANIEVNVNEFIAITGPSGSGRSSLLCLIGLLDTPTSRSIVLRNIDTSTFNEDKLADTRLSEIGFVLQFHLLLPEFTAFENMIIPMRRLGRLSDREMMEHAEQILSELGGDLVLHQFHPYSCLMRKLLLAAFCCASFSPAAILAQAKTYSFTSVCDASAAVHLSGSRFAVADDEINLIQVYSLITPGEPVANSPLSISSTPAISNKKGTKKKKGKASPASQTNTTVKAHKGPEADLEAAARMGDSLVWLGSHSRDAKGNDAPARREVFYSSISRDAAGVESLSPLPHRYTSLLDALSASALLAHLNLTLASTLSPKVAGGLNIEGITLLPDHSALLGLRNPLLGTQAILIHTTSPFDWSESKPVEITGITPVNLDGRGIKDLAMLGADLLIASSAPTDSTKGALFAWRNYPSGKVSALNLPEIRGLNIEGILPIPERNSVLLLSDDGTMMVDGKECKKLKNHSRRRFRAVEVPTSSFVG